MLENGSSRKPIAFVLMPFDTKYDWVLDDIIKEALEAVGYEVVRADNILDQQNALKNVVCGLVNADIIVADLSGSNPNVFYELGIAHSLNRPVILITDSMDDIPFDLKSYVTTDYSRDHPVAKVAIGKLKAIGEGAKNGEIKFGNPVSDFLPLCEKIEDAPEMVNGDEDELGFLDYLQDAETSLKTITAIIEQLISETKANTERIKLRTRELTSIQESDSPDKISRQAKHAKIVALDFNRYTKILSDIQIESERSWDKFGSSTVAFLKIVKIENKEDREALIKYRAAVVEMKNGVMIAKDAISKYQESIEVIRDIKVSRELIRATKDQISKIQSYQDIYSKGESYCEDILLQIDSMLQNDNSSE